MSVQGDVEGRVERSTARPERFETVVIGGGQAGLAVGYQLTKQGGQFVILEANERIGDSWRKRWDSLRLFTPARYNGLDGFPFPADDWSFSTKDEMADYLEAYAARFDLPVRTGVRVKRLSRDGDRFVVETQAGVFEAENVVVAMADFQRPRVPEFARELDRDIVQIHSYDYRNPSQLRDGAVLVVGPVTRGPRSRSKSPAPIARGCRAGIQGTCRSASRAMPRGFFWHPWRSALSSTAC